MEITPEIRSVCERIAKLYKEQLIKDNAVAKGTLRDSVDNFETDISAGIFSLYFNLPHYWKYAPENVRQGHNMPPVSAIRQWIEDKGLNLNEWAVAKKIAEVGWRYQPRKNLQETIDSNEMDELIDELINLLMEELEDDALNELN